MQRWGLGRVCDVLSAVWGHGFGIWGAEGRNHAVWSWEHVMRGTGSTSGPWRLCGYSSEHRVLDVGLENFLVFPFTLTPSNLPSAFGCWNESALLESPRRRFQPQTPQNLAALLKDMSSLATQHKNPAFCKVSVSGRAHNTDPKLMSMYLTIREGMHGPYMIYDACILSL